MDLQVKRRAVSRKAPANSTPKLFPISRRQVIGLMALERSQMTLQMALARGVVPSHRDRFARGLDRFGEISNLGVSRGQGIHAILVRPMSHLARLLRVGDGALGVLGGKIATDGEEPSPIVERIGHGVRSLRALDPAVESGKAFADLRKARVKRRLAKIGAQVGDVRTSGGWGVPLLASIQIGPGLSIVSEAVKRDGPEIIGGGECRLQPRRGIAVLARLGPLARAQVTARPIEMSHEIHRVGPNRRGVIDDRLGVAIKSRQAKSRVIVELRPIDRALAARESALVRDQEEGQAKTENLPARSHRDWK